MCVYMYVYIYIYIYIYIHVFFDANRSPPRRATLRRSLPPGGGPGTGGTSRRSRM